MLCTYSSRCLRRCCYALGATAFALLCGLVGWSAVDLLGSSSDAAEALAALLRTLRPFDGGQQLGDSDIWFAAVVQVCCSTGIGVGVWPVLTGKFLYKGDAVRTTMVYMCFNVLVTALAAAFFATQYAAPQSLNLTAIALPELKPLTAIYDAATNEPDAQLARLRPGLAYALCALSALLTMAIAVYTTSRFVQRHPNYTFGVLGLVVAVAAALLAPRYVVARVLDTPVTGVFICAALCFDIMAITWIYGAKNIYTDLEFSIGRPIWRAWVAVWCVAPVLLAAVLAWWASELGGGIDVGLGVGMELPRWTPIAFAVAVIAIVACVQVS